MFHDVSFLPGETLRPIPRSLLTSRNSELIVPLDSKFNLISRNPLMFRYVLGVLKRPRFKEAKIRKISESVDANTRSLLPNLAADVVYPDYCCEES